MSNIHTRLLVVVVVVLTLTRIIKSVVTGQAPVTLEMRNTTYILHVVSITTHTHDRHKSIGEKRNKEKKRR